ncbi:MAG: hypothetical protein K8W52_19785 [Deltaproteobacteria bacterium]|nr:hypothetical protein [Deltaproteobacteria bacterium]
MTADLTPADFDCHETRGVGPAVCRRLMADWQHKLADAVAAKQLTSIPQACS